jgi:hypothetical protein
MNKCKQKRQKQKLSRSDREAALGRIELSVALKKGTIIAVDRSKVVSRRALPQIPDYYQDTLFTCKDCGKQELWTAKQQQRWYEDQGGEIEAIANRCSPCRRKEKRRRDAARKIHLEGVARKRNAKV